MTPPSADSDQSQRYRCMVQSCKETQRLPEDPLTAPLTVRAGCSNCEAVTRHMKAVLDHD